MKDISNKKLFPTQNCETCTKEFNVSNCSKDFKWTVYCQIGCEVKNLIHPRTWETFSIYLYRNKNKYKSLHYSNKSSALFQIYICVVSWLCVWLHILYCYCWNRMLHITSFTLNSYRINSISKWLRHMYSIMAQQYQIPGLMAIIFSQFIFVLFLPIHIRSLFSYMKFTLVPFSCV